MNPGRGPLAATGPFLLAAANLLIPAAILIFATGFFPYKPFLTGLSQYEDLGYGPPPAAPFDRLVFMVVDALRSDFVYDEGSGFEYTQGLIRDGFAIPFTAHAASPTVTMPRIKAITTGSIPSFLDVILNINEADTSSTLASQDTWLAQMKAKKSGKLLLYGDDTWLKLFPDTFDRADGTSSFFVSDFTEVDNNVTRHVDAEMRESDWNTMILHYLGLDHIGHKSGPRSSNMWPKQREMDGIVRKIYEAIETEPHLQSTLLVLCGDHGMNDAGNHGASSAGETSPAMVFMSPKLKSISRTLQVPAPHADDFRYYSLVEQSDLAPTLAALLGFPVPKNNLGTFILEFLPCWPDRRDQVHILMHNARQIFNIMTAASGDSVFTDTFEDVDCSQLPSPTDASACRWHALNRTSLSTYDDGERLNAEASKWLRDAQGVLSSMASNYNTTRLIQGGATVTLSIVLAFLACRVLAVGSAGSIIPYMGIAVLYGIMMFASSYVEEEQHYWYWCTTAWFVHLSRRRTLIPLVALRLMRGWNQTGQKFAGSPDVVKMFMVPNPELLWCLIFGAYAMVAIELMHGTGGLPTVISRPVIIGLIASALSFKIAFTNEDAPELVIGPIHSLLSLLGDASLVARARAVFLGLALVSAYPVYLVLVSGRNFGQKALQLLHSLYTLLALTQSRATNIPLFVLFGVLQGYLEQLDLDVAEITTSSLLLQFASFFAMGGSNAISSVDLSSAYNGVSDFNVAAVGVLTFISNWAAPVWWTLATTKLLLRRRASSTSFSSSSWASPYQVHIALLTVFIATSLGFVMAACTALRTHLFIWTVFSPKYLYGMAWSLGQHLVVNVGVGGLLFWLGGRGMRQVNRAS